MSKNNKNNNKDNNKDNNKNNDKNNDIQLTSWLDYYPTGIFNIKDGQLKTNNFTDNQTAQSIAMQRMRKMSERGFIKDDEIVKVTERFTNNHSDINFDMDTKFNTKYYELETIIGLFIVIFIFIIIIRF